MFPRIVVGIIIGLVVGFFLSKPSTTGDWNGLVFGFTSLIVIAFIASSFIFGAIYGVMAIGEIVLGYWLSTMFMNQAKPGQ